MPFKSAKQERFMWAKHPNIARRWAHTYGSYESRNESFTADHEKPKKKKKKT